MDINIQRPKTNHLEPRRRTIQSFPPTSSYGSLEDNFSYIQPSRGLRQSTGTSSNASFKLRAPPTTHTRRAIKIISSTLELAPTRDHHRHYPSYLTPDGVNMSHVTSRLLSITIARLL